ncbi:ATP synthase subunit I [Oscillatoriales cyanobacterium LEGE 11467]|uniref:ATP synthase subunit I n=1 Tax=Zarconia navalis LEGE 11467 TaxID=1828826 RepID=A0A928VY14_9CYAN|nr:ATP synthase subunit I [Zarconia navalis]MBE9042282.1 ATP synthase subunit I [Zarconia navalis LEGE 11467]
MLPPDDRTESESYYPRFRRSEVAGVRTTAVQPSVKSEAVVEEATTSESSSRFPSSEEIARGMEDYAKLKQELYGVTLLLTGFIFAAVWMFYSLNIALNYAIGAFSGLVYLRLLARNVDRLGPEDPSVSKARFAVFVGAIIFATQLDRLQILPIFLGFLTYKVTLIVYTVRITLLPEFSTSGDSQSSSFEESS